MLEAIPYKKSKAANRRPCLLGVPFTADNAPFPWAETAAST
jgi:hypothetical protein